MFNEKTTQYLTKIRNIKRELKTYQDVAKSDKRRALKENDEWGSGYSGGFYRGVDLALSYLTDIEILIERNNDNDFRS